MTKLIKISIEGSMQIVNVHQAKTHLSRLIDDAHAGETIVLAKAGKPWARPYAPGTARSPAHPCPVAKPGPP